MHTYICTSLTYLQNSAAARGGIKATPSAGGFCDYHYRTYWEDEIVKAAKACPYACITNAIEHMITECEMVFHGTKHANDYCIYHDAFTMMH